MRHRGRFCAPDGLHGHLGCLGIEASPESDLSAAKGPIVTAGYYDMKRVCRSGRHLILFEHGAGFSFSNAHPSYAGGAHQRALVGLFACPNEQSAQRNRRRFPGCRAVVVGCPKMDALAVLPEKRPADPPTVCISFHWDCLVAPETRSALAWYEDVLGDVAEHWPLILHSHPRSADKVRAVAERLGIEYVASFADVCRRADVYANDASSTLYEFAALDRPVVVLNAPWYRRKVFHGLRFWEHADVGVQCDEPGEMVGAITAAIADTDRQRELRSDAVDDVYPYLGGSVVRAAHYVESYGDLVATGRVYPRDPLPLPAGCRVDCEDERTAEDVLRWHGSGCLSGDAEYVAKLGAGVRLTGSLEPAFRALIAGWDHIAVEKPYPYKAAKTPRMLEHDSRASFHRIGAPADGPTWILAASFALEFDGV